MKLIYVLRIYGDIHKIFVLSKKSNQITTLGTCVLVAHNIETMNAFVLPYEADVKYEMEGNLR